MTLTATEIINIASSLFPGAANPFLDEEESAAALLFPGENRCGEGNIIILIDSQGGIPIGPLTLELLMDASEPAPEIQTQDQSEPQNNYCNFPLRRIIDEEDMYFCVFVATWGDKSDWTVKDNDDLSTQRRVNIDPTKIVIHPPQP